MERTCKECGKLKPLSEYYLRKNGNVVSSRCKPCYIAQAPAAGTNKRRLVEAHGGRCMDCGESYPPFVFDFDHRNPADKEFNIATRTRNAWDELLAESLKCDLVCSNCHRLRTHRQRCPGCEHCAT